MSIPLLSIYQHKILLCPRAFACFQQSPWRMRIVVIQLHALCIILQAHVVKFSNHTHIVVSASPCWYSQKSLTA